MDRQRLYNAHVERMVKLEDWYRGESQMAMYPREIKEAQRQAEEAAVWRREAEEWAKNDAN